MTVEEYQIAQLYSVAQASKNETGGGEGIEVLKNEPFSVTHNPPETPLLGGRYTDGQYTHKIYRIQSKVPNFVRWFAPAGSLEFHEKAWNGYPYCRTVITNPDYMKDNFFLKIETLHSPDRGTQDNAHQLPPDLLSKREVHIIDIANDPVSRSDYKEEWDPTKYKSHKTGRGPLQGKWIDSVQPVMCAYKLVTVKFQWFGLQNKVERFVGRTENRLFLNFHRQVFCWTDEWFGMTMKDIRDLEDRTKTELDEQMNTGEVRGTKPEDDE